MNIILNIFFSFRPLWGVETWRLTFKHKSRNMSFCRILFTTKTSTLFFSFLKIIMRCLGHTVTLSCHTCIHILLNSHFSKRHRHDLYVCTQHASMPCCSELTGMWTWTWDSNLSQTWVVIFVLRLDLKVLSFFFVMTFLSGLKLKIFLI